MDLHNFDLVVDLKFYFFLQIFSEFNDFSSSFLFLSTLICTGGIFSKDSLASFSNSLFSEIFLFSNNKLLPSTETITSPFLDHKI